MNLADNYFKLSLVICTLTIFCGCAGVQPVAPDTPPIVLDKSFTGHWDAVFPTTVILPAGVYRPQFRTPRGTYYLAPAMVIFGKDVESGGLCIPNSTNDRAAFWLEGEIGLGKRPWHTLSEPVPYHQ